MAIRVQNWSACGGGGAAGVVPLLYSVTKTKPKFSPFRPVLHTVRFHPPTQCACLRGSWAALSC